MRAETEQQPIRRAWRLDPNRGIAKIIGDEVRKHGSCCLARPTIGRLAGICKTSVDKGLQQFVEHGMIKIEPRASGTTKPDNSCAT